MGDVLEFDRRPSMLWMSLRAALRNGRRNFPEGKFRRRLPDVRTNLRLEEGIDARRLTAYREVCGLDTESTVVPPLYPFIVASPLHTALAAGRKFPYATLGLVHVRQAVVQTRPIEVGERITVQAWFADERDAKRGVEIDIATHVHSGHELVWSAMATALARDPARRRSPDEPAATPSESRGLESQPLEVAANMGRRYAKVCGDYNPIHLRPWMARRFGFDQPIVHGMWSLARGLAALERKQKRAAHAIGIQARFLAPVTLPSTVRMFEFSDETGHGFSWRDESGENKHLECTIRGGVREHLR
jgi:acyl dehydratase